MTSRQIRASSKILKEKRKFASEVAHDAKKAKAEKRKQVLNDLRKRWKLLKNYQEQRNVEVEQMETANDEISFADKIA